MGRYQFWSDLFHGMAQGAQAPNPAMSYRADLPMPASAYPSIPGLGAAKSPTSDPTSGLVQGGVQPQIHSHGTRKPSHTPKIPQLASGIPEDLGITGGADVGYNPQALSMAGDQPDLESHSPIMDMMQPMIPQAPMSQGQDVSGSVPHLPVTPYGPQPQKHALLKALLHRMF
jgi:hypothetical protein